MHESLLRQIPSRETRSHTDAIGIVFCGGSGTRLREITHNTLPKHLLPLDGTTTILDTTVHSLKAAGVNRILLITTTATMDHIQRHAQWHPDLYAGTTIFQNPNKVKNGMGSVLAEIRQHMPLTTTLIKMDGDMVHRGLSISDMLRFHTGHTAPITAVVTRSGNFTHTITLDKDLQRVVHIDSDQSLTSPYTYGITGTWIIDPSYVSALIRAPDTQTFLHNAIQEDAVRWYMFDGPSININTPDDYVRARMLWCK